MRTSLVCLIAIVACLRAEAGSPAVEPVRAQAGIRFDLESIAATTAIALEPDARFDTEFARVKAMIPRDRLSDAAIDICYVKSVRPNGCYYEEPIFVKDTAGGSAAKWAKAGYHVKLVSVTNGAVRFAEAFEICEYGRQPSPDDIRVLFPFFP